MIYLMGDIHGYFEAMIKVNRFVNEDDIVIQVGDFGVQHSMVMQWNHLYPAVKCPVYFIDGNHENFDIIDEWPKDKVKEVAKNLFYIPRGMVMTMQGIRIGFLGGAESVDKAWRRTKSPGQEWWAQERITEEDVARLVKNVGDQPLDVLITHCPPPTTVLSNFPMINTQSWGLPSNWVDISSHLVAEAIDKVKPKRVYSGHMHKKVFHQADGYTVRILDVEEVECL